ncbi:MAG: TrkA family potassium uptake protein [Clostridiaceae bacterium]
MRKKQFVVIGLGRFGASVAKTLYKMGHDVLAIDKDEDVVQDISDSVTHAIQMEATDESGLRSVGIRNFDVAVISVGSNIQASIMVTLLVKEMGVSYIICKGNSEIHEKVLYKIGADKVIQPEKDMGVRVAHNLVSSNILDYIELSDEYSVIEIEAAPGWCNKTLKELDLRSKYGINVMAIRKEETINVAPASDIIISEGDVVIAIGSSENLLKLEDYITKKK